MANIMAGLSSFGSGINVAVVGASGGIGSAMVAHLLDDPAVNTVHAFSRRKLHETTDTGQGRARLVSATMDIEDEDTIAAAARGITGPLHLIIIATGLLHTGGMGPEKALKELEPAKAARSFMVNAVGPALVAKHFLPLLPREGKTALAALSARVGSISDNRIGGWHSYRASKAALNMFLRNIAIEAGRKYPELVVCGLQPGTVDTSLSKPFQGAVKKDHLLAPEFAAGRLLEVIDGLGPSQSGQLFDWAGNGFAP